MPDQSPVAEHGAGWMARFATGSVGWGMRTKWAKHLANVRQKVPCIFGEMQIAQIRDYLHTNRFKFNMRDRWGLMWVTMASEGRLGRQWLAASTSVVMEPGCASALCSGCSDGSWDLCLRSLFNFVTLFRAQNLITFCRFSLRWS